MRERQASVLNDLETVIGAGYDLILEGFSSIKKAKEVKYKIAPSLIWEDALYWDRLDVALQRKQAADELALAGDFRGALDRFECIFDHLLSRCMGFSSPELTKGAPTLRWHYLHFDLYMSRAALNLRLESIPQMVLQDIETLEDGDFYERMISEKMHLQLVHILTLARLLSVDDNATFEECDTIWTFFDFIEQIPVKDDYVAHDEAILKAAVTAEFKVCMVHSMRLVRN